VDVFRQLAAQGAMIERLSSDSRRCAPGVAFLAYPGEAADGRAHIGDAIARGAAAVVWEEKDFAWRGEWRVPNVPVHGLKQQAGALAHEFYGRPSESLWVCGVSGTNGKTSCSQWIAALLDKTGSKAGVIGTLGSGYPGALSALINTTPDAVETQFLLKNFLAEGARAVAMEVSSHGLVQGRLNGVRFACALFTNLSHDHLDYHGSMAAYAQAKARLFDAPGLQAAVLNLDDALGVELAGRLAGRVRTIGYSLTGRGSGVDEYIAAVGIAGSQVEIESSWGKAKASISQLGRFNVANALGVLGCLVANGISFDEGAALLATLPSVPGRMQAVGEEPLVVIDYAHTPDALENVLQALRPVAAARGGRLAVVFGAGGDRDATKRPLMGAIAARLADRVLVTSDNPRSEDPLLIIEAIRRGASGCEVEPDRARAIEKTISGCEKNDVVLIAGKGHEAYQEIAGRRVHFSDEEHARAALARRGG
jgi:UDP-N-acetylmuramoyl-L-alanyl-D-glutamate--2,6-diaminopimelate ligase